MTDTNTDQSHEEMRLEGAPVSEKDVADTSEKGVKEQAAAPAEEEGSTTLVSEKDAQPRGDKKGSVTPGSVTPGSVTPGSVTPGSVTPVRCRKCNGVYHDLVHYDPDSKALGSWFRARDYYKGNNWPSFQEKWYVYGTELRCPNCGNCYVRPDNFRLDIVHAVDVGDANSVKGVADTSAKDEESVKSEEGVTDTSEDVEKGLKSADGEKSAPATEQEATASETEAPVRVEESAEGVVRDPLEDVTVYRDMHPNATWQEVFEAVETGYKNANALKSGWHKMRKRENTGG